MKRVSRFLTLLLLLLFSPTPLLGRQSDSAEKVHAKLEQFRAESGFPGINAAVIFRNRRNFTVSVGLADVESARALKPRDRMLAGSTGKTFVAAAALKLVEEGKLTLDEPASRRLGEEPWFKRLPNAESLTVRHLMRHTSGIPEHVLDRDFLNAIKASPRRVWNPSELLAFALDKPALFPVGQGWSYADTNYIVLGLIVERAAGRSLYQEVERRFLKPLRLSGTIPAISPKTPRLVTGYARPANPFGASGSVMADGKLIVNPQFEWAGGGFASTAEDLARWALELYGGKVLKPETRSEAFDAVPAKTGRGDKYGLGVQVRESAWGVTYGHGGWFPGYLTEMEYFPDKDAAIALQFNTDDFSKLKRSPRAYVAEIARIVFGE